ncbi:response regulator, partial [Eisenbergiella porci]
MQDILLVEDDEDLAEGIQMALGGEFSMIHCKTVEEAKHILYDRTFGLLILDVGLPDGSGLKLCGEIRKSSRVPIVLLTARDMETDIVAGLEY